MAFRVIITLGIGIPLIILVKRFLSRIVRNKFSPQSELLIVRLVYYVCLLILFMSVLNEFGFKLSALLGAAGVFGIAIGFASQTSVSNIISGIFLISEKPFVIGDSIRVGASTGEVQSIDLLSIKLKTADNSFVRIPNETMIKSEVTNLTHYPQRRVNIRLTVSAANDIQRVIDVLSEIAAAEPLAEQDHAPVIQVENIGPAGIELLCGVWCATADVARLKNNLIIRIKDNFAAQGIEIPFPRLSLGEGIQDITINKTSKEV